MLGLMKCSLYRRNVWIFGPESNLKKLHNIGQDGQLGEGTEGRCPQGNMAALRALLNGTGTERRAAVAVEHLLCIRHRENAIDKLPHFLTTT